MKFFAHLLDLFDLLIKTANHIICRIRNLLNLHKINQWIYFTRQDNMKHIAAASKSNSCGRRELRNIYTFINIYDIFAFWMHLKIAITSYIQEDEWETLAPL